MNIKEKIGSRIKQERTSKGLTRKALAELTDSLKISRINNYERGERTPGPEEIKQLAKVLEVSPSFLMCLSDDRQGKLNKTPGFGTLIPVLDYKQACDPVFHIEKIKNENYSDKVDLIPISSSLQERMGKYSFAVTIKDDSMAPEFRVNDVLIIDPDTLPNPGEFIAVQVDAASDIVVRKYKQLSASELNPEFELIALNSDWANIHITNEVKCKIIGTVIHLSRNIK